MTKFVRAPAGVWIKTVPRNQLGTGSPDCPACFEPARRVIATGSVTDRDGRLQAVTFHCSGCGARLEVLVLQETGPDR